MYTLSYCWRVKMTIYHTRVTYKAREYAAAQGGPASPGALSRQALFFNRNKQALFLSQNKVFIMFEGINMGQYFI